MKRHLITALIYYRLDGELFIREFDGQYINNQMKMRDKRAHLAAVHNDDIFNRFIIPALRDIL